MEIDEKELAELTRQLGRHADLYRERAEAHRKHAHKTMALMMICAFVILVHGVQTLLTVIEITCPESTGGTGGHH